jgi:calcium-dependent protein kinase
MGVVLCDCDKRISRDQPNDFPTDKKIESPITPLSNISTSFISKKTSFRTINSTSSIEEHMLIDKTVIIGKGEGDINDTYEIGKKIGGGTYGIVFLSLNKRTKEKVAIKAMKKLKKDNKTLNEDILKEIEMLKTLDHQNIINIFEFYEGDYNFYIVTEYCQSGNLLDKINKTNLQISESRTSVIIFQILSAINYCHQRNIIHRDLKPENIMLDNNSTNGYPYVKLIDFGTAKFRETEYENQLIGSPYFIAPEVIDKKYTNKCDVWSIGVILYFLISRKKPFTGFSFKEIFNSIKEDEINLKTSPFNSVSEELKDLIKKLLTKNPNERISADEALQHKWFIKNKTKEKLSELNSKDLNNLLDNIKNYYPNNFLQQSSLIYLVNKYPNAETVKKASSLYIKLDKDNNGIIDYDEFVNGCQILFEEKGENIEKNFLIDCYDRIDSNNNGKIEYDEFIRAAINKKEFLSQSMMKQAFEHFDNDKSESITVDDMIKVFGFNDNNNHLNEFQKIIDECDIDKNGAIELNEFISIMEKILK